MKQFFLIINFVMFGLMLTITGARAQPPIIDTDKSMYNLDPYFWVYSAAHYEWLGVNPNLWPKEGHNVSIGFSLEGYAGGSPSSLTFSVEGLAEVVGGVMVEDTGSSGIYRGIFDVSEASVGGVLFKPGEKDVEGTSLLPKVVTLTISDVNGAVAERQVKITRWGCDRCHMAKSVATGVYSWSNPAGGPLGPHSWPNVLGRNGGRPGFSYENLTNDRLTHTPTVGGYVTDADTGELVWRKNPLDRPPYHQQTNTKIAGGEACSPCHQGSGRVRSAYGGIEGMNLYLSRERSLTVKCVFCHSLDSGYVPTGDNSLWENWVLQGWN